MSRHIEPMNADPDAVLKDIERRIHGRKLAHDVMGLIDIDDRESPIVMEAFIEHLRAHCLPATQQAPQSTPEPIGRLGRTPMPFGQYAGKTLDDCPLDYLNWLCREQEEFYARLRAYLRHPDLESRRRGFDIHPERITDDD